MIEVICNYCGKKIKVHICKLRRNNNFYCNNNCYKKWKISNRKEIECCICGEKRILPSCRIKSNVTGQFYCNSCRKKERIKLKCDYCGKKFERRYSKIKDNKHYLCSNKCANKWKSANLIGKGIPNSNIKGIKRSPETKRKIRIAYLKRKQEQLAENGQFYPHYNSKACKFFKHFDEVLNTQGQYATNGGEYYIKGLGYWVDYINSDMKIIIEWDEESHYKNGELKEKDARREREIKEALPDYDIFRIREKMAEYHSLPA